jgi:hypothetical protein
MKTIKQALCHSPKKTGSEIKLFFKNNGMKVTMESLIECRTR